MDAVSVVGRRPMNMCVKRAHTVVLALLAIGALASVAADTSQTFAVDRNDSHAMIHVGKAGAFSFVAGHTHKVAVPVITGTIMLDPDDLPRSQVTLEMDARQLKVTGQGEPPKDVPEVQRVMLSDKVLDAEQYPTITFRSTSVSVTNQSGTNATMHVTGPLTLHHVTQSISVSVEIERRTDMLTARGRFQIKQSDYGIKPVSVGGVVAVKDSVEITFVIVARKQQAS